MVPFSTPPKEKSFVYWRKREAVDFGTPDTEEELQHQHRRMRENLQRFSLTRDSPSPAPFLLLHPETIAGQISSRRKIELPEKKDSSRLIVGRFTTKIRLSHQESAIKTTMRYNFIPLRWL